jgi:VWFA-related protein
MLLTARFGLRILLLTAALGGLVAAQEPQPSPPPPDVLRVTTELVQSEVMVFDKQGHFVTGLQREQFELTVDGKPQPISLFEEVRAGTAKERVQLSSVIDSRILLRPTSPIESQGRTIVFFIDDLHLSLDSLARTRKTLAQFIEKQMTEIDRVAIASTSGDIGFLQQFTDNKSVLRAAAGRLIHHPYNVRDMSRENTPMTEYMALTIERKDDPGVFRFYVDECLRVAPPRYTRAACEIEVTNRARQMLLQSSAVILETYKALESLMRSSTNMPGRKLVFFISDGFLLDTGSRNSDPRSRISQITDAALRAGAVIYTIDARGLFSGQLDATNNVPFDPRGGLENANLREGPASQDALNALAVDTGGRALRNQNFFDRWVDKVLDETSNYYLLAWRPDNEEQTGGNFRRIAVRVVDHPEFTVRLPRGFLRAANAKPPPIIEAPRQPQQDLQEALTTLHPRREVPLALMSLFLDTPEHGAVLTASVGVSNVALSYEPSGGKEVAAVDVVGVIVSDRGKPLNTFKTRLTVDSVTSTSDSPDNSLTIYNYRVPLGPGLYQIRVAARDVNSGRVGSTQGWIEIPNLALHQLSLSSLLLGLQTVVRRGNSSDEPQVQFNTDLRFTRNSNLRFMIFVYNLQDVKSEVAVQARLLHRGQVVETISLARLKVEPSDPARIPFAGEFSLNSVPAGDYLLEVTAAERTGKASANQVARIRVE